MAEHDIGPLAAIPPGEGRLFDVGGTQIAVFHGRSGYVYATQASCPHKDGPLADGLIGGTTLICPLHERAFDLRTGAGIGNTDCLRVYPAHISGNNRVILKLP
jgi:nitrite reductase (NADH) small subunit